MTVVPAGVHDSVVERAILYVADLLHRQRVHVGTQQRYRPGPLAAQRRQDAGLSDARADLVDAEAAQLPLDELSGLELLQRQLGMLMKMPPIADEVLHYFAPVAIGLNQSRLFA